MIKRLCGARQRWLKSRADLPESRREYLAAMEDIYWIQATSTTDKSALVDFASLYVTSRCHLHCIHCHAEESFLGMKKDHDASTEQLIRVINALCLLCRRIQLTGGEIMMRRDPTSACNDVPLLIREIYARGKETIVQTTGMGIDQPFIDHMKRHGVRWVSLSLDGPNPEVDARIRGTKAGFYEVIQLIPRLKAAGLHVKVGSVVTSVTNQFGEFLQLGRMLNSLHVDVWKITQFFPRQLGRRSLKNAARLSVSTDGYKKLVAKVRDSFPASPMRVVSHSLDVFARAPALLVQPSGAVSITEGTSDVFLGDVTILPTAEMLQRLRLHADTIFKNGKNTYSS